MNRQWNFSGVNTGTAFIKEFLNYLHCAIKRYTLSTWFADDTQIFYAGDNVILFCYVILSRTVTFFETSMIHLFADNHFCYTTEEKETTKCQKEYLAATKNPVPGRYVPRCDLDGSYANVQCRGSVCYCVDKETGGEVIGTRTSIETGRPVCKEPCKRLIFTLIAHSDVLTVTANTSFILLWRWHSQ